MYNYLSSPAQVGFEFCVSFSGLTDKVGSSLGHRLSLLLFVSCR